MTLSDVTRPANGSYSYGYILMANTFGIKAKKQFTNTMHTYEVEQVAIIAGQKMPPQILQMSIIRWTDPSPLVECGGAGGTAGTYTEILDQFDTDDYTESHPVTGGTLSADLITNADGLVVTAPKPLIGSLVFKHSQPLWW